MIVTGAAGVLGASVCAIAEEQGAEVVLLDVVKIPQIKNKFMNFLSSKEKKNIVVTGGSGFIGRTLISKLLVHKSFNLFNVDKTFLDVLQLGAINPIDFSFVAIKVMF